MADPSGKRSTFRPCLALLAMLATTLQPGLAQVCSFWDGGCVDPYAQTAVTFDFSPLLLDDLTLYYAYDANSRGKGNEPMTKASFWMGTEAHHMNSAVIDSNRTLEVGLRVGNLTGTPSGGTNGCDGVWGPQCSMNLKETLKEAIFQLSVKGEYYTYPLETVLHEMLVNPPGLPNCPPPFFDVQRIPVQPFASETVSDKLARIKTSGSSDNPWKTWYIDNMTAKQQADQVAVAIISRSPSYDSPPLKSKNDVQIELVCLQAPSSGGSSSNEDAT
ncbi:hypothetical protein ETB97_009725 [Aspergillus alliaceus]|uniref:Uncharacterized protein n=1 Tax=Petromyces alliaceus TaxID=209559 RepID=A0A5N7CRL1_PETAA|nr:uncharacterized protein BDW43DRAFT_20492 [Aspergillus alliaceus]KAB8236092.1 hypothetical protein BDW43DRAFT_20492 [Aspergillus alliaceus]KAE8396203.1 hypothetical protein BDV23DRAFT_45766 [Aspergillus alliaceus]KAF5863631.1 hypothetical protein ETB97_009725 [Aspergillus burnettii]